MCKHKDLQAANCHIRQTTSDIRKYSDIVSQRSNRLEKVGDIAYLWIFSYASYPDC